MMKLLAPFVALVGALVAMILIDDEPPRADVVFVNRGEVFTLDPQRMSWLNDLRMAYALYEGLVRWNNDDFSIEPAAAGAWTVDDARLTYTFSIRPDARWSNNDAVTAHDFVYAWRRAMLPDTASDYSNLFMLIEGAEPFFRWRGDALAAFAAAAGDLDPDERRRRAEDLWRETERRFQETVALKAVDDRTLRVTLVRPTPYFLDLVAFGVFCPVHPATVEPFVRLDPATGRLDQRQGWTKPGHLVSNGPYVLRQWRYKRGLYLEANPLYHSPGHVRNRTVSCVSIEDINTAVLAFESGQIDWLSDVGTEYEADMLAERFAYETRYAREIEAGRAAGRRLDDVLAELPEPREGERRDIHVLPAFGTDFYSFNCRPLLTDGRDNPLADARVRRAFVMCVDKRAIVEKVTRLNEPVATTLIPPGSIPGYRGPRGLPHDPARARTELEAAGWVDRDGDGLVEDASGQPFPVIDLLYSTSGRRYKNISLALRDMWQRELGVRVELRGKDTKFFKEDLKTGHFMIGRGGWYGDYGDPTTYLDMFRTGDGNNDRGYSSPYIDELLETAARETDPQRRLAQLAECERFLMDEEVPMLVLCQYVTVYMYAPDRLSGLSHHPRLVQYLWKMKVHR